MSDTYGQFQTRCDGLQRKHSALAKGYTAKLGDDGLITLVPRRRRSYITARLIAGTIAGVIAFKSLALALIGPIGYQERIDALAAGTTYETVAAWIMQPDPVSSQIAALIISTFP